MNLNISRHRRKTCQLVTRHGLRETCQAMIRSSAVGECERRWLQISGSYHLSSAGMTAVSITYTASIMSPTEIRTCMSTNIQPKRTRASHSATCRLHQARLQGLTCSPCLAQHHPPPVHPASDCQDRDLALIFRRCRCRLLSSNPEILKKYRKRIRSRQTHEAGGALSTRKLIHCFLLSKGAESVAHDLSQ